ncbi:MAG TPA: hypothetical protein VLA82_06180 [Actinomycetota bacterium]|nr:hypothetical protein [Actinomycetota bacterium]
MPWDLVRDGESMSIDVDLLQQGEVDPLLAAVRAQVADGVTDVGVVYRAEVDDDVVRVIDRLLATIEAYGASTRVVHP